MEWFLAMVEEPRQSLAKKCCPCSCTPRTLRVKPNSGALPLSAHTPCFGDRPQAERRPPRQVARTGLRPSVFLGLGSPCVAGRFFVRGGEDVRGGAELSAERVYWTPCGAWHLVVRGDAVVGAGGYGVRGVHSGAGERGGGGGSVGAEGLCSCCLVLRAIKLTNLLLAVVLFCSRCWCCWCYWCC